MRLQSPLDKFCTNIQKTFIFQTYSSKSHDNEPVTFPLILFLFPNSLDKIKV